MSVMFWPICCIYRGAKNANLKSHKHGINQGLTPEARQLLVPSASTNSAEMRAGGPASLIANSSNKRTKVLCCSFVSLRLMFARH
jgi:hypothetical protein